MTTKFNITFPNGVKMSVVSADCSTPEQLGMSMFGTEKPKAEITLADQPVPAKEPVKAPVKKA